MQIDATKKLFSVEEYHRMGEAGVLGPRDRVELLDGEIFQMTAMGPRHIWCLIRINRLLTLTFDGRAAVAPQLPLRLNDHSEPEPDLMLLRKERVDTGEAPSAEDALLVLEISDSSLPYDRDVKLAHYAAAGIPEFWIVDLEARVLRTWRNPSGRTYTWSQVLAPDATVSVEAFPDRVFRVSELVG